MSFRHQTALFKPSVIPVIKLIIKFKNSSNFWSSIHVYKLLFSLDLNLLKLMMECINDRGNNAVCSLKVESLMEFYSHKSWRWRTVISSVWWKYHSQDWQEWRYWRVPKGLGTKLPVYDVLSESQAVTDSTLSFRSQQSGNSGTEDPLLLYITARKELYKLLSISSYCEKRFVCFFAYIKQE